MLVTNPFEDPAPFELEENSGGITSVSYAGTERLEPRLTEDFIICATDLPLPRRGLRTPLGELAPSG